MSNDHLNAESSPTPDKDWEATALSFVENTATKATDNKSPKKRRFSSRALTVILSSTFTVLVAIAVLLMTLFGGGQVDPNTDDGDTTQPTQTDNDTNPGIVLLDKTGDADKGRTASQLASIAIKNKEDSFTIHYDETTKSYVIKGYEDIDLDPSLITTLRSFTETIKAADRVQNVSSLATFGLDNPQATAAVTYSDQSTTTISIGNQTPSKSGYYTQIKGDDNVYIFDANATTLFRAAAPAFASTQLIATPTIKTDDKYGTALLRDITFSGPSFSSPLSLRRSNHNDSEEMTYFSYLITSPYFRAVRDSVANALGQFKSMSADQALFLHPTDEQLKKLGFNTPLLTIQATMAVETEKETESEDEVAEKIYYNSAEYHITVGSKDNNGNYIVTMDGIDAIFLVDKSYNYLFDMTYENTVNEFLFVKNIDSISRVLIRYNGNEHEFTLSHYPNKEDPDDQLVIKEGEKVYSTSDFRNLYGLMLKLERHGQIDKKPDSDVPLEITLYDLSGDLCLSAKYYNASGSLCVVETNENELFTTRWSYVSFFIQQVDNYLNGRDVLINT